MRFDVDGYLTYIYDSVAETMPHVTSTADADVAMPENAPTLTGGKMDELETIRANMAGVETHPDQRFPQHVS